MSTYTQIKILDKDNEEIVLSSTAEFKDWFISRMDMGEIKNGGYADMAADDLFDAELNINTANFKIISAV